MNRRGFIAQAATAAALALTPSLAQARTPAMEAVVSISRQRLQLFENGSKTAEWPVSTARRGKITPQGSWAPYFLSKHHRSSLYNNAPMPFSVFYNGNYAVHGTNQEHLLGQPASAGCVRLSVANARVFFEKTQRLGMKNVRVRVVA